MEELEYRGNSRCPGEIIETYSRPYPAEVVEEYRRCLFPNQAPPPPKKKSRRGLWIFLACVAAVVMISGIAWAYVITHLPAPQEEDGTQESYYTGEAVNIPTYPVGQGGSLTVVRDHGETLTAQEVYRKVNPSVVTVMVQLDSWSMSVGTGVIFTEDGYILTNYHVLEGGQDCVISLSNGDVYSALYVAGDQENDLAILKVEAENLPAAEFRDSDLLTVGDQVYAIGNPLGVDLQGTLTDGIVSAINRDVEVDGRIMTLIQTNAALNTGNSGGPLINEYGQVVGINVIKMRSDDSTVEGLGFAIPTATMERIVNDLLRTGKTEPEPLLGLSAALDAVELSPGVWGLEVVEVIPNGAAAEAGVQVGDYILAADGEETWSSRDLMRVRRRHYVGEEMTLTLWRWGSTLEVQLQLTQTVEDAPASSGYFVLP